MTTQNVPLYQSGAATPDWWHHLFYVSLFISVIAALAIAGSQGVRATGLTMFIISVNVAWIGLARPRRFEIWPDRLRIVHPLWSDDLPLRDVVRVRPASWHETFFRHRPWQTTSVSKAMILQCNRGVFSFASNRILSPANPDEFIHYLREAWSAAEHESS